MNDRAPPEDIVVQGSEKARRFTLPEGWRPSRAAGVLAVMTLVAGLAIGYAIGKSDRATARTPAIRSTATGSTASPADQGSASILLSGPALTEGTDTCSTQVGQNLELGIPVTNMSTVTVVLRSAKPIPNAPSMLKVLSWHWEPCGFNAGGIIPDAVILGPGATTWVTATVKPLVACPASAPLQFLITYTVDQLKTSFTLPGFADLSAVRYSGCKDQ